MGTVRVIILIGFSLLLFSSEILGQSGTCAGMSIGPGANLNGFVPFPSDNAWNTDISAVPVDPNSANIIAFIGATAPLHPDFGAGLYQGSAIGIPYQVEDLTQPKIPIKIGAYKDGTDPDVDYAKRMIKEVVDRYGRLDILVNSAGIWKMMSGSPICHPLANLGGAGRSLAFPSTAPPSIQVTTASTSFCVSRRSFSHLP